MNGLFRRAYQEVKNKLDELESEIKTLESKKQDVSDSLSELICKVIKEEKLLSAGDWTIETYNHIPGSYRLSSNSANFHELSEIADVNWHAYLYFDDIELRFSDGKMILIFNKGIKTSPLDFIKEHNIKIDNARLDKEIDILNDKLTSFQTLKKAFEL